MRGGRKRKRNKNATQFRWINSYLSQNSICMSHLKLVSERQNIYIYIFYCASELKYRRDSTYKWLNEMV